MTDILDALDRAAFVRYKDGWESRTLAKEAANEITRLRTALSAAEQREKGARSPFHVVAEWHDKQARQLKEMSADIRVGQLGMAKAAEASKHHAGSAAALRLAVIKERQDSNNSANPESAE